LPFSTTTPNGPFLATTASSLILNPPVKNLLTRLYSIHVAVIFCLPQRLHW
jgi:hypothetical protein